MSGTQIVGAEKLLELEIVSSDIYWNFCLTFEMGSPRKYIPKLWFQNFWIEEESSNREFFF